MKTEKERIALFFFHGGRLITAYQCKRIAQGQDPEARDTCRRSAPRYTIKWGKNANCTTAHVTQAHFIKTIINILII